MGEEWRCDLGHNLQILVFVLGGVGFPRVCYNSMHLLFS